MTVTGKVRKVEMRAAGRRHPGPAATRRPSSTPDRARRRDRLLEPAGLRSSARESRRVDACIEQLVAWYTQTVKEGHDRPWPDRDPATAARRRRPDVAAVADNFVALMRTFSKARARMLAAADARRRVVGARAAQEPADRGPDARGRAGRRTAVRPVHGQPAGRRAGQGRPARAPRRPRRRPGQPARAHRRRGRRGAGRPRPTPAAVLRRHARRLERPRTCSRFAALLARFTDAYDDRQHPRD